MRRATATGLFAITLLSSMICGAQAPSISTVERLYAQYDQFMSNRDANNALGFYEPYAVFTGVRVGRITVSQERQSMMALFAKSRSFQANTVVKEVKWQGGRLVVNNTAEWRYETYSLQA